MDVCRTVTNVGLYSQCLKIHQKSLIFTKLCPLGMLPNFYQSFEARRLKLGLHGKPKNCVCPLLCHRTMATVSKLGGRNFACSPYSWGFGLLAIEIRPPRPPRPSADLRYFRCQKSIEGGIFRGCVMNPKLLSDLDLGGPGDLRSDLRGHPRPRFYLKV